MVKGKGHTKWFVSEMYPVSPLDVGKKSGSISCLVTVAVVFDAKSPLCVHSYTYAIIE